MKLSTYVMTMLRSNILKIESSTLKFNGQTSYIVFRILDETRFNNFMLSTGNTSHSRFLGCKRSCFSCMFHEFCSDNHGKFIKFFGVIDNGNLSEIISYSGHSIYTKIYFHHHEI